VTERETLKTEAALLGRQYARFKAKRDRITATMTLVMSEWVRAEAAMREYDRTHLNEVAVHSDIIIVPPNISQFAFVFADAVRTASRVVAPDEVPRV